MKLTTVTRMKNEIDIAEAFVRHHAAFVDRLIIIDDFSSDGTYDRLRSLKDEGLPIELHREREVGIKQSTTITRFMAIAFETTDTDWVVPIDADEFLEVRGRDLDDVLPKNCRSAVEMRWDNFVWTGDDRVEAEPNPVLRLTLRMPTRRWHFKVMVPRSIGCRPGAALSEGSHAVSIAGQDCETLYLDELRLCHYPIRSVDQFTYKSVAGYLHSHAVHRDRGPNANFHYCTPMSLLRSDMTRFNEHLGEMSRRYSMSESEKDEGEPREAPLDYRGGPLRYSTATSAVVPVLSHLLEDLSRQLSEKTRQVEALKALVEDSATRKGKAESETAGAMDAITRDAIADNVSLRRRLQAAHDAIAAAECDRQSLRFLVGSALRLARGRTLERLPGRRKAHGNA